MDSTGIAELFARLDAGDDAGIYELVQTGPDHSAHLPLSDQHRVDLALRRIGAIRALNAAVGTAGSPWRSIEDDQATVAAWWAAVDAGCGFAGDPEQRLEVHAREARHRLHSHADQPPEPPPPAPRPEREPLATENGVPPAYPFVTLQLAIIQGDLEQIRSAAAGLRRDGVELPVAYQAAVAVAHETSGPGAEIDLSVLAEESAQAVAAIQDAARFSYGHHIVRAQAALAALAAFRAAQAAGHEAGTARAWSKLATCWPGLLSPDSDAAGRHAFEHHGRRLVQSGESGNLAGGSA